MVYQPPVGARDLLPLDVAQKQWIEERLQHVFQRWGYYRIITSTLERMDTLMAGGAIHRSTVIQLQELEGEELGLRPELTASIARAIVARLGTITFPQRLYYMANVFRRPAKGMHNGQRESYQAGVELIGSNGTLADAEMVFILTDCMERLGLSSWHLILGEAGLTRSLLSSFPAPLQGEIREAIAALDRVALEHLPLSPELCDRALMLMDLRGHPADVLQRVSTLDLDESQRESVNALKSVVELLQETLTARAGTAPNLILDLSVIQTFDYYTGIVFEVVAGSPSRQQVLGQGGRYDRLLGLYHPQGQTLPGIGFSLNIEALQQILLSSGQLPSQTPTSHWLVIPKTPQAYSAALTYAHKLRTSTHLVRVELDLGTPGTLEERREEARRRGVNQLVWVEATGLPAIERLTP